MRNLIDILDFSTEEIDGLVEVASDIMESPEKYADAAKGKILGTLFFEPSTRTRLSFTSAMMSLGGNVLGFSSALSSSVSPFNCSIVGILPTFSATLIGSPITMRCL